VHLLCDALPRPARGAPLRVVVAGVGNAFRRDDGAGIAVAEEVRRRAPDVEVVTCEQEPSRLLDAWSGADTAIVVDAVSSGAPAGTVHRFDASAGPVPASVFRGSTHALGVGEAIELARALGRLPASVLVYGIEGREFAAGEGLTPAVAAAVEPLAAEVLAKARRTTGR
jgi:hydrogenase maturation protease